ncbi:hypothetical protein M407DRAFT_17191 [Tulasnella calospora MUT 4182]|uniref:Kri1-like C-terminal domain-containing protein n=1 Tax=Tulasnella calospora MUT 4182 TaxID=1051891 RepID=A0A0C3QXT5_9AGAM|nr:hypothetical protein M407DRAFT_17191 [Tulasnella calospora MUT 4182]
MPVILLGTDAHQHTTSPMASSASDSEEALQKTINVAHAKALKLKRKRAQETSQKEKQELAQLRKQFGSDLDDNEPSAESDEETEDEDGDEFDAATDVALLKTLALIQKKDPAIYDTSTNVFGGRSLWPPYTSYDTNASSPATEMEKQVSTSAPSKRPKKKDDKPLTYKAQLAATLLGKPSEEQEPLEPTYAEEQEALRRETISAFHGAIDEGEGDDDGLLVMRKEFKDDVDEDDEEYRAYVQKEVGDIKQLLWVDEDARAAVRPDDEEGEGEHIIAESSKKKEKRKKKKPQDEAEQFLANYLLNRAWIDRKSKKVPTMDEVTSRKGKERAVDEFDEELDEDFEELEEDFEATYNFRFEEPDGSKIPRHPRKIETLARRSESTRKEARERREQRRDDEFQKKKEEVRRQKNEKVKTLKEKLEEIGKEGGLNMAAAKATLESLDLDGDFDPAEFDKQMAAIYENDALYDDENMEKPEWDDDEAIYEEAMDDAPEGSRHSDQAVNGQGEDTAPQHQDKMEEAESGKEKRKKKKKKKGAEVQQDAGVDVNEMDAEVAQPKADDEEWDGTEEMRKRVLKKYLDDIYKLDFNDMVSGIPTRFSYIPVPKERFSLTSAEILRATDKELNQYVGMKQLAAHKRKRSGYDKNRSQKLYELKRAISRRSWGGVSQSSQNPSKDKRKRSKKEQRQPKPQDEPTSRVAVEEGAPRKKRRKESKKLSSS